MDKSFVQRTAILCKFDDLVAVRALELTIPPEPSLRLPMIL